MVVENYIQELNKVSNKTYIVNCHENPNYDIYIGRPSLWSNPFKIGKDGTREEVIEKFRQYLKEQPHLVEAAKEHLKGKVLGCHCLPAPCHGQVWCEILNENTGE